MFANIEESYRLDKSSILCFYRQLVRPEFDTHSNGMTTGQAFEMSSISNRSSIVASIACFGSIGRIYIDYSNSFESRFIVNEIL